MKLLHAVHNHPPEFTGGTEAYVHALAREQAARGHDVVVAAGSERDGGDVVEEQHGGIRVLRVRRRIASERYSVDLRVARHEEVLRGLLARERPDVVHVHHWQNLAAPLVAIARDLGIPAVVTLHDYLAVCPRFFLVRPDGAFCGDAPVPLERCLDCCGSEFAGDRNALAAEFAARRAFFDAEMEAASAVIVPSERAARILRETGILRAGLPQVDVVPHGLRSGLARPAAPAPRDPDGKLRLAFFGNVAPVKGVDLLLEAVRALPGELRDRVRIVILGEATDAALSRRIDDLSAGLDVRREGSFDRARLERLATEVDAAVFPGAAAETYSLVVDEALALGLPVVVSDRGAAAERAGAAAEVVRTGDVADLARAIRTLLERPARLAEMRAAVPERSFTAADNADRIDAIYRRVVAAPAGEAGFDASFRFVPLRPFERVPGGRVVVLAPHPDDEVIGAGGAIALHARRGDAVAVVHVTDGAPAAGDRARVAATRRAEAEAAGSVLGVRARVLLGFPDGALRPGGAFASGLTGALETLRPDVLYVPSPFEHHPDHRATTLLAALALDALAKGGLAPRVVLYEVNEPQRASYLLDVTSVFAAKEEALRCFASQRGALDVVKKSLDANRARTMNVDLPAVAAAEAYFETDREGLRAWIGAVDALRRTADRLAAAAVQPSAAASAADRPAAASAARTAPVTCVISTWNKRDDVRENLAALGRQTLRPAEIVVVDNASSDGTARMIRAEFPHVKLIEMPHSRFGACETFNVGMRAATQPLTAIMDDDVVAPPEWLDRLVERLEREPPTTAMISSNVIEPGMPEEFLEAERRERYMATFRGCGTLARSDVLRRAGYYDERFFIYGNERDLAARVLGLGCRILQYPRAEIFHKTPFGMKAGPRSLYYHVRNFWLYAFKNCSVRQIVRAALVLIGKGLGLRKESSHAADASGTIGIDRAVKETPRGLWIAAKGTLAAFALLPYCLRRRRVCTAPDFVPPVH